jgi:hypothetical protein
MNTPTPRTDDFCNGLRSNCLETTQGAVDLANFARQLERELNEARQCFEISKGNTEAALNSFHAEMKQRRNAEAERDQLRRVVDEFARQSPGDDKWLMADYRDLPHVRAAPR